MTPDQAVAAFQAGRLSRDELFAFLSDGSRRFRRFLEEHQDEMDILLLDTERVWEETGMSFDNSSVDDEAPSEISKGAASNGGEPLMDCSVCGRSLEPQSNFCPECGSLVEHAPDLRGPNDIDLEWLADGLRAMDMDVQLSENDPNLLYTQHAAIPSFCVSLRKDWPAITFLSFWGFVDRQPNGLLELVGQANAASWYCHFAAHEDSVTTSSVFPVSTQVSHEDVQRFVHACTQDLFRACATSGLSEVLGS